MTAIIPAATTAAAGTATAASAATGASTAAGASTAGAAAVTATAVPAATTATAPTPPTCRGRVGHQEAHGQQNHNRHQYPSHNIPPQIRASVLTSWANAALANDSQPSADRPVQAFSRENGGAMKNAAGRHVPEGFAPVGTAVDAACTGDATGEVGFSPRGPRGISRFAASRHTHRIRDCVIPFAADFRTDPHVSPRWGRYSCLPRKVGHSWQTRTFAPPNALLPVFAMWLGVQVLLRQRFRRRVTSSSRGPRPEQVRVSAERS